MDEMNEFRKPYEYEEEKGVTGFLMLFFIMVLTFEILLGVITLIQGYLFLKPGSWMSTAFLVFGSAYFLLTLFTCIALYKIPKHAIQISKIYLFVRAIYLTIACLVIFDRVSKNSRIIQSFSSMNYFYLSYLGIPLIYIFGFSVAWLWYFRKSKKIKEYQEMATSHPSLLTEAPRRQGDDV